MKLKGLHVRWPLIVAAAVTGLAAYGAYLYRPKPTLPSAAPKTSTNHVQKAAKHSEVETAKQSKPAQASYESAIRPNMFNGPAPPEPKPASPPAKPPVVIVTPPPPPDPLADANYAGSATVDGQTTALIESRATHQGEYVFAGGTWQGHNVVEVAADHVVLSVNGVNRTLMSSDEVNIVPLSASAAGTGSPTSQSQGGPKPPAAAGPQTDPNAARLQMMMKYKSAIDSAKGMLQMRNIEMEMSAAQDKTQFLKMTK